MALPKGFTPPPELAGARAIAINSVPMSPALDPPTGLHLWYSTDEKLLNWTEYRNASSVQSKQNATCVICPEDAPAHYRPGYIGDNYVWSETAVDGSSTFYVLSGSTRCAEGHPWCSYQGIGGNSTAQALVFKSTDLLSWSLVSDWDFLPKQQAWPAGFPTTSKSQWPGQRIDTPDTFALVEPTTGTPQQVFVWLNSPGCNTHWMLGSMDNITKDFTPSTRIGCADRGTMFCQQSLTTPSGTRVSLGWIQAGGDGWDGAQSLPRVVSLDTFGVAYSSLPALASLHLDYRFAHHLTIAAGATEALPEISGFGSSLHMIVKSDGSTGLSPLTDSASLSLSLLGGACVIDLSYTRPNSTSCASGAIANNTDCKMDIVSSRLNFLA